MSLATGGTDCCITRPPGGSRPHSSAANAPSSRTSPTDAVIDHLAQAHRSGMIGGRRPLRGVKPADRRVRVERPHSLYFRYQGHGQLVAKPAAYVALTARERLVNRIRG